jgi:hypothetical protein
MKIARVSATFPEQKASSCYAEGKGSGSSPRVAIARAFENLLRQPNLKGKRVSRITANIVVTDEVRSVAQSGS